MDATTDDPGHRPGRLRWAAGVLAVLLAGGAAPPPAAAPAAPPGPASESDPAWAFRFSPCVDAKVAPLVGQPKDAAIAKIKTMNLRAVRMLDPAAVVTYEVAPQRLTLVIDGRGVVTRAFCR